jgi:hypothetical protein
MHTRLCMCWWSIAQESSSVEGGKYVTAYCNCKSKSKAISVTDCGGLQGCETFSIPRCTDNQLADGSEIVSLTRRQSSTFQNFFFISATHFC